MQLNEDMIKEIIKLINLEKYSELIEILAKYEINSTIDNQEN